MKEAARGFKDAVAAAAAASSEKEGSWDKRKTDAIDEVYIVERNWGLICFRASKKSKSTYDS